MPIDTCDCCGGELAWNWSDAFNKFGFNDGDGQVMTHVVCDALTDAGYVVQSTQWRLHNVIIVSIVCPTRCELMPANGGEYVVGYDDPRSYLPDDIIDLLDGALPD